jgi:hypothetical protein
MADLLLTGAAAVRTAEALLRGTGGRAVVLRIPAPALQGEADQMGLAAPEFQDVELAPCVFRKCGQRSELLVSADAVQRMVGALSFDSAKVLFATAAGVLVDAQLLRVESVTAVESAGVAVCYRVKLAAA